MIKTAKISPCGQYRYRLGRLWDESLPVCLWIMLNPSKADADIDDKHDQAVCQLLEGMGLRPDLGRQPIRVADHLPGGVVPS